MNYRKTRSIQLYLLVNMVKNTWIIASVFVSFWNLTHFIAIFPIHWIANPFAMKSAFFRWGQSIPSSSRRRVRFSWRHKAKKLRPQKISVASYPYHILILYLLQYTLFICQERGFSFKKIFFLAPSLKFWQIFCYFLKYWRLNKNYFRKINPLVRRVI